MHRFFDSDFFYAFRRSPIAIVSLIVVVFYGVERLARQLHCANQPL